MALSSAPSSRLPFSLRTGATRPRMSSDESLQPWVARDDVILEAGPDGRTIGSVNAELADWRINAAVLASAPNLLEAVRASRDAIEEAGQHLPLDSRADLLALKAFGLCVDAILRSFGLYPPQPADDA